MCIRDRVWAAALLDAHDVLASEVPDGESLAWRICLDALRGLHQGADAGPHFVHARKSWMRAFEALAPKDAVDALREKIDAVFERRGLGDGATSDGIRFSDAHPSNGGFV